LLLIMLDLSRWIAIMVAAIVDKDKRLGRLREAHQVLGQFLEKDELDFEEALQNTYVVENALRIANPHEDRSDLPRPADLSKAGEDSPNLPPLLAQINIAPAHKAAFKDFFENILTMQSEKNLASLETTGRGLVIPFLLS
jgi:hypothetical protein